MLKIPWKHCTRCLELRSEWCALMLGVNYFASFNWPVSWKAALSWLPQSTWEQVTSYAEPAWLPGLPPTCCSSGLVVVPYSWPHPTQPARMCQEVNTYLLCMVGCALPLLWACLMQSRLQQRLRPPAAAGTVAETGAPWQACPQPRVLNALTSLVLASSAAWCAGGLAPLVYGRLNVAD